MSWFERLLPAKIRPSKDRKSSIPEGLWTKCEACGSFLFKNELQRNLDVCPKCGHHMRIGARSRLGYFLDPESSIEIAAELETVDRLKFKDTKRYKDRISAAQRKTGETEALIAMQGKLNGMDLVAVAFEFGFIGGSMGTVVGEKFFRACSLAIENACPFICFATSGGARMQESLFSLTQMAKTSAVLDKLAAAKLPFISVLLDPCTGGVSASLAMLGDLNIAEPNALICFAGPRVMGQNKDKLPENFQRSEFLLEKGAIDMIVDRRDLRQTIYTLLTTFLNEKK